MSQVKKIFGSNNLQHSATLRVSFILYAIMQKATNSTVSTDLLSGKLESDLMAGLLRRCRGMGVA
jgi:hypothetical protein